MNDGLGRLDRDLLPLDLPLPDQKQGEHGSRQADQAAEREDVVEARQESLTRRVSDLMTGGRRDARDRLLEAARRCRLDQLAGMIAGRERGARQQIADLGSALTDEDRTPDRDADGDPDLAEGV